ncbi:hypothetical protein J6590_107895, partial [Homalodisca vitripennis]
MPKDKSNNPKYPCGVCSIGAKYSSIKCTGPCGFWFHGGCVHISDGQLKKLSKEEISSYRCKNCSMSHPVQNTNHLLGSHALETSCIKDNCHAQIRMNSSEVLNSPIKELECSLIENNLLEESNNDDHKLQMAAKIGSALLEENKILKEEKFKLETRLTIVEGKLEELEIEEKKHIDRIEILLQQNAASQDQLNKEKQLRQESQAIFEEHDRKLNQLIDSHLRKLDQQEKTIF